MSDTTTPETPKTTSAEKRQAVNDSLISQQFILGIYAMTIVAMTVGAVFVRGNDSAINVALGFIFGSMGGGVISFFFGSSKGSQSKDNLLVSQKESTP